MRKIKLSQAIAAVLLAVPLLASAVGSNLVMNGSFEDDAQAFETWSIRPNLNGWTGNTDIELRNNVAGAAFDGVNYVELDTTKNSSMSQSFNTTFGQTYQLSFAYSPRENVGSNSNGIEVFWNGGSLGTFSGTGSASGNTWRVETLDVLGTGEWTTLRFDAVGTSDSLGGSLDNVSVTAVPEPQTYALMLAGLGVMGFLVRRRKN